MPQIMIIGDVSIDNFITLPENYVEACCDIHTHNDSLILPYGAKIPIKTSELTLGGNAANVSVGLSRLEIKTLPIIPIGRDEFSHYALALLEKENVHIDEANIIEGVVCDVHTILRFLSERTILSVHTPRMYDIPTEAAVQYIYLSSHSANNISMSTQVLKLVAENESKLIFAPGNAQINGEVEILESLISKSYLFICNKLEAFEILSRIDQKEVNPTNMLFRLNHFGATNVVITDGPNGVYFLDGQSLENGQLRSLADKTKIVDTTGAGDATCSGIIYGLIKQLSLQQSVEIGIKNALSVLKQVGAQKGLLRKEDL